MMPLVLKTQSVNMKFNLNFCQKESRKFLSFIKGDNIDSLNVILRQL
jgi:hypothetical protein